MVAPSCNGALLVPGVSVRGLWTLVSGCPPPQTSSQPKSDVEGLVPLSVMVDPSALHRALGTSQMHALLRRGWNHGVFLLLLLQMAAFRNIVTGKPRTGTAMLEHTIKTVKKKKPL